MGVIRHKPRSANVIAWDEVDVMHISDVEWRKFLNKFPRAAIAQLADAEDRIDEATRKIVDSDFAVEQRLAKALVELVDRGLAESSGSTRSIRLSQDDIASLTRSSVVSVKKALKIFKESNVVSTGRLTVTIHDMDQLTNIANDKPVPW
jgi:CRP-like cAMP-binding protein